MVKIDRLFGQIVPKRILVAGDFILDRYTFGKSKRISPEAPVPVVLVESEEDRLGGAGNVVLNLAALGMQAVPFGCIGPDEEGKALLAQFEQNLISTEALLLDPSYNTPLKKRIIAANQQVVRVDYEQQNVLSTDCESKALQMVPDLVASVDLIAISDYAKGFLTDKVLVSLIQQARACGIPVICDPKGSHFEKYAGATVLKPNYSEAVTASRLGPKASIEEVAREVLKTVAVDILMITRSESGISLYFPDGGSEDLPVQIKKEVRDVTGAGDTVLAMLACAMANGLTASQGAQLANIAATFAVERVGCATVTLSEVARRYIDQHAETKIFTEDTICALRQVLRGQNFIMLHLVQKKTISSELLKKIRNLGKEQEELVVFLEGVDEEHELIEVLASLKDVDYILLSKDEGSCNLLQLQHPARFEVY